MALDGDRLGDAIQAALDALPGTDRAENFRAIGQAIVAEITGHGVVTATGVDPQGGTVTSTGTVS